MATVRVFLPTYCRPRLLERAIASLRAQTFPDWLCEVHNDAPDDNTPARLLARLGDARISCHRHARNLGGTATFNLFFRATAEPFYAMLEDDNAWRPDFLTAMLSVASRHPDVTVFWSNQRLCREQPGGEVRDTGRLVHPDVGDKTPHPIEWGRTSQIFGALHAHSAALFRSRPGEAFTTPLVPIALVEAFRERLLPHPMVFVPEPLAEFTQTLHTARSDDRAEWAVLQTMLAASFLKHAACADSQLHTLCVDARSQNPPATGTLLLAGMVEPACKPLRRHMRAVDWLRLLRSIVRRPTVLAHVLRCRREHAGWWEFLDRATAARFAERAARLAASRQS